MLRVAIRCDSVFAIDDYARIPIAFEVRSVFEVGIARGQLVLSERHIAAPYTKDYDKGADAPATWASQFDLSQWKLFAATLEGQRIGGAVLALATPGVDMLEGRADLAVLWDIRVAPDMRGRGVGAALLRAAEVEALERGCVELKVETQSINVQACRFYEENGFVLRAANRDAYPTHPEEVQLLWYKPLGGS